MKTVTGKWIRPDGTPAAGAVVQFLLSQDAASATDGQIGHYPIFATLEADGTLPFIGSVDGMAIEANDELLPAQTYYTVSVKDPVFGMIYFERLVLAGASPINLNLIPPVQK